MLRLLERILVQAQQPEGTSLQYLSGRIASAQYNLPKGKGQKAKNKLGRIASDRIEAEAQEKAQEVRSIDRFKETVTQPFCKNHSPRCFRNELSCYTSNMEMIANGETQGVGAIRRGTFRAPIFDF